MKIADTKQQKKHRSHKVRRLVLGALILKSAIWLSQRENRQAVTEAMKLTQDKVDNLKQQAKKSHWFADYFIPHLGNGHKPKILHRKVVRTIAISLLAIKVAIVSLLFAVVPSGAFNSPTVENDMVRLTNEYRSAIGSPVLVRNEYLDSVALSRAQDMMERDYFSHYSPEGLKPWEWVDQSQYDFIRFGENLAIDFVTAPAVLKAFQASPSHDKNLRNDAYQELGIAMLSGDFDGRQTNVLVLLFGSRETVKTIQAETTPVTPEPEVVPIAVPAVPEPEVVPTPAPVEVVPESVPEKPRTIIIDGELVQAPEAQPTVAGDEAIVSIPTNKVEITAPGTQGFVQRAAEYSNNLYLTLILAFILIALVNILVAFKIQHKGTIVASLFMIVLATYLWYVDWHQLESINGAITVFGYVF